MFQYVLFDLDGTLTDPKEGITKSVQFALRRQGIHEPDLDKLEPFIGPPLQDGFMEFYGMTEEEAAMACADYRKRFAPIGIFENKVYPGIGEMLGRLREAGMKLAVASSKPEPFVRQILDHFALAAYFDVVTGSLPDGTRSQKEEVVREALLRLQAAEEREKGAGAAGGQAGEAGADAAAAHTVQADENAAAERVPIGAQTCAMVGDRKFDIYGAKEFGLTAIGVSYGYAQKGELEAAGADFIAKSVRQLEKFLLDGRLPGKTKAGGEGQSADSGGETEGDRISPFLKTWNILFPFILYYLGYNLCYMVIVTIVQIFSQTGEEASGWLYGNSTALANLARACSMLTGAGILFPLFRKEKTKWRSRTGASFLTFGVLAATAALGVNILFTLCGITSISHQYTQVQETQYQIPLLQGLVLYGFVSPLAEEMLFRGLIYNRMKKYFPVAAAGVISSILFGAYHGNVVQGAYGALLGALIAYSYEITGDFRIPVFVHGMANSIVFVLTYHREISASVGTPVNCAVFLIISVVSLLNVQRSGQWERN